MRLFPFHPNPIQPEEHQIEKKIFIHSLVFPSLFVFIIWMIKISESILNLRLTELGIYPLETRGLIGILTSPLIHGDWSHLIANTTSIFVLMVGLFYFYRSLGYRIFLLIYFLSGIGLWIGGRPSWHIGASGLVYGFATFLFFSGIIRKDSRLLTISLIVTFLYGGLFWGIFPTKPGVSWEGHLWGAVAGLVLSIVYRHRGPKQHHFPWEFEEEDDDDDDDEKEKENEGEENSNKEDYYLQPSDLASKKEQE